MNSNSASLHHIIACCATAIFLIFPSLTSAQNSSPEKLAQAKKLAELAHSFDNLEPLIASVSRAISASPLPALLKKSPTELEQLITSSATSSLNKDGLLAATAEAYATQFSDAELTDLITFYNSDIGKKFAEKRPLLNNVITDTAISQLLSHQAHSAMDKAIEAQVATLNGEAKKVYLESINAEPIPNLNQLLVGKWKGISVYDKDTADETHSFWNIDRKSDGTHAINGVDLIPAAKSYDSYNSNHRWKTQGRILFEMDSADPSWVSIFILDSVTEDTIIYRLIDETPPSTWVKETDRRGTVNLPELQEGWTDTSESDL